jgi:hypothetical protein
MNYQTQLQETTNQIETLQAQLATLTNQQTILTQLVDMEGKMEILKNQLNQPTPTTQPYNIIDLEKGQYHYYNCVFGGKVNDEEDYNRSLEVGHNGAELTEVQRIIELDTNLFAEFKACNIEYFDWLGNFGGSTCNIDLEAKYPQFKEELNDQNKLMILLQNNEDVKKDWFDGIMQIGTLIVDKNDKKDFLIANQQGYNYAKYISYPSHITQVPTPATLTK